MSLSTLSREQSKRLVSDFVRMAGGESVVVEQISGVIYVYTTELGAMRISLKYLPQMASGSARVGYSENLGTWYFRLER